MVILDGENNGIKCIELTQKEDERERLYKEFYRKALENNRVVCEGEIDLETWFELVKMDGGGK